MPGEKIGLDSPYKLNPEQDQEFGSDVPVVKGSPDDIYTQETRHKRAKKAGQSEYSGF